MARTVSAVTVTWNSAGDIAGLIDSLAMQGEDVLEVTVVDNASTDGTQELVGERMPGARIIENRVNRGFAAAANQGIAVSSGEFILLVNPDVSFGPGFARTLAAAVESEPNAGSAAPKLFRPGGEILDSAGLVMRKTRKAVDRGRDEPDSEAFKSPCRVFGPTGAAALFRREALEDAKVGGEYFDERFFAYKEDVDLAWRMNLLGWNCLYEPRAVGTHSRGWKVSKRGEVPRSVRTGSFRNHYLTIMKNDDPANLLIHLPWVLYYDIQLFFYALLREPFLFKGFWEALKLMPEMADKREEVMARRKVGPAGMRRLFG